MKVFLQLRADVHAQALHNQGQRIREAAEALEERERIRGARIMMLQGEDNPDFPRVLDADLHGDQDQDPPDYQVVPDLELNAELGHVAKVDEGEVIELHDPGPGGAVLGQGEVLAGVQPEAKAYGGAQPAGQDRGSREEQLRPCGALETAQRRKIGSGRERHEATGARGQQGQGGPRRPAGQVRDGGRDH